MPRCCRFCGCYLARSNQMGSREWVACCSAHGVSIAAVPAFEVRLVQTLVPMFFKSPLWHVLIVHACLQSTVSVLWSAQDSEERAPQHLSACQLSFPDILVVHAASCSSQSAVHVGIRSSIAWHRVDGALQPLVNLQRAEVAQARVDTSQASCCAG